MNNTYKAVSAAEAVKVIKSGDHIHLSSVASAPECLIEAMCERGRNKEFKNVYIHHLHTEGPAPYANQEFEGIFQHDAFFVGSNVRKDVQAGYADYIPIFLSEPKSCTERVICLAMSPWCRFVLPMHTDTFLWERALMPHWLPWRLQRPL